MMTIKKGDRFYFASDRGTIYTCIDYVYRPDAITLKTYITIVQGKLYPIYICAKTMEKAIIINQQKPIAP